MKTLSKKQLDADTLFAFQMALKGHKQFEYLSGNRKWYSTSYVSAGTPHRIYHDIPEGWTRHDGEDYPGNPDDVIEAVMFCNGFKTEANKAASYYSAAEYFKHDSPHHRIYAYKLAAKSPAIPAGFTAWNGGECPVDGFSKVEYILRHNDEPSGPDVANALIWKHGAKAYDIIAYRVIEKKVIPWTFSEAPDNLKVKDKDTGDVYAATIHTDGYSLFGKMDERDWIDATFETLAADYLQLDGSICGKEVEQ